jgi:hypothetical protein
VIATFSDASAYARAVKACAQIAHQCKAGEPGRGKPRVTVGDHAHLNLVVAPAFIARTDLVLTLGSPCSAQPHDPRAVLGCA